MELVVDANVVMSALIADSKTRDLIVTLVPTLVTPAVVHDETEEYEALIVEKSGLDQRRVRQFIELLVEYLETIPASEFYGHIDQADEAIGHTDLDDVLYVACAIEREAGIWSDDTDFEEQDLVPVFTTNEVLDAFDTA